MNNKALLLLVSGLLMSITLIAVTSSISHSVNIGSHQGEKHDITPIISSLESSFPLALEHEVGTAAEGISLSESFEEVAQTFESILISRGYSSSFILTTASEQDETHTFVYSYTLSDGVMGIELDKTITF